MSIRLTAKETADWLVERDNFLILTHRRPDGDTLGSAGGLAMGLREIGKTVYVLENEEATPRYAPYVNDFWAPKGYAFDHIISIDTASSALFTQNAKDYRNRVSLSIDHHRSNTEYAEYLCLDDKAAACGELVYEIATLLTDTITRDLAIRLYVAVATDTGCFSFGNVTANTFAVASKLVETGIPVAEINKKLFRSRSRGRVRLEGLLTSGLEFFFDGQLAIATITADMIESSDATEDDMDNIADVASGIDGVKMGITIRELTAPDDCKISVRSIEPYDSNAVCKFFGGGGHKSAAGSIIKKPVEEIKALLLEVTRGIFS